MEAYQLIHPAVAAFAILLFVATAWTKLGPKKYYRVHYGLAGATVTMMIVAIGLAGYAFLRCDCQDDWPFTMFIHGFVAALFLLFLLAQATMGVTMVTSWLNPKVSMAAGGAAFVATVAPAIVWLQAWYTYVEIGPIPYVLPLAMFPLLWLGELRAVTKRPPWVGVLVRGAMGAIPAAIALIWAMMAMSSGAPGGS